MVAIFNQQTPTPTLTKRQIIEAQEFCNSISIQMLKDVYAMAESPDPNAMAKELDMVQEVVHDRMFIRFGIEADSLGWNSRLLNLDKDQEMISLMETYVRLAEQIG